MFFVSPLTARRITPPSVDLILSSGFLAFSRHLGVLEAIDRRGLSTDAIVGTSSGALVGALAQAGVPLSEIAEILAGEPPLRSLSLNRKPWQGLFCTRRAAGILERYLPRKFEDLPKPLAVGVCDSRGMHHLLHQGPLVPALLASIAIPRVFPSVAIEGVRYCDGGVADRVGVDAWRRWRPQRCAIVHIVARSRGREVPFDPVDTIVIRTPRTHAQFWSLGDFPGQLQEARMLADHTLSRANGSLSQNP